MVSFILCQSIKHKAAHRFDNLLVEKAESDSELSTVCIHFD